MGEGADIKLKSAKKKSPTIEENKSKKEHINVVFIGHVGELCRIRTIVHVSIGGQWTMDIGHNPIFNIFCSF